MNYIVATILRSLIFVGFTGILILIYFLTQAFTEYVKVRCEDDWPDYWEPIAIFLGIIIFLLLILAWVLGGFFIFTVLFKEVPKYIIRKGVCYLNVDNTWEYWFKFPNVKEIKLCNL